VQTRIAIKIGKQPATTLLAIFGGRHQADQASSRHTYCTVKEPTHSAIISKYTSALSSQNMVGKYFIAAKVPPSVQRQFDHLYSHHHHHHHGLSWYTGEWLIVPIRYFGHHIHDLDEAIVALHSLHSIHSATATLGHKAHVLGDDLVYVPVHGLDGMAREVRKKTRHIGEDEMHSFVGRIAVVKRDHGSHHHHLPHITEKFRGQFDVDKLYLMHSVHDHNGHVQYDELDRVHLGHHH
jgi:2'-5' RNA ligase